MGPWDLPQTNFPDTLPVFSTVFQTGHYKQEDTAQSCPRVCLETQWVLPKYDCVKSRLWVLTYKVCLTPTPRNFCFLLLQGGFFFSPPPPNLTKSQALYKVLDLGNLGGGQFPHGGDLVKLRGGERKNHPVVGVFQTRAVPCSPNSGDLPYLEDFRKQQRKQHRNSVLFSKWLKTP